MRSVRKGFSEPELCASSRATAGGFFTAMSPPEETTSIKLVRPAMDLQQVTGTNAKWVPA